MTYRCLFRRIGGGPWEVYRTGYVTKKEADERGVWLKVNGWWRDTANRMFLAGSVHSTKTEKE